jgi:hypothetical protein
MSLSVFHPVIYADRVWFHKCAFTTARTISLGAGCSENTAPYFSRSDASMLVKYNWLAVHHALIRRIVLPSQGTPPVSPAMIFSHVSAQCLLYGMMTQGSS